VQPYEQHSSSPPLRGPPEADTEAVLERKVAKLERSLEESEKRLSGLMLELAVTARQLTETKLLVREVDHRAKNSLQIASSMLHLQAARADDSRLKGELASTMRRLQNLAAIHAALYEGEDAESVPARSWLERICYAFEVKGSVALSVEAPNSSWPVPLVRSMGLFAGEAVANTLKYAFTDGRAGRLSVRLVPSERGLWRLEIADDGDGCVEHIREGLGFKLLRTFAAQIGGRFELAQGLGGRGLTVAVVFPGPDEEGRRLL
jgi:two-component sensor histidine kinase